MAHILKNVLNAEDAASIHAATFSPNFSEEAREKLWRALWEDPVFQMRARPAGVSAPTVLRNGQTIWSGADDALRADLVVVVFLTSPAEYDGGELIVDSGWGEEFFKESAGSCVIYPAEARAAFRPVVSGAQSCARLCAQSLLREAAQREILYDVSRAARYLEIFKGRADPSAELLKSCEDSLLRLWRER